MWESTKRSYVARFGFRTCPNGGSLRQYEKKKGHKRSGEKEGTIAPDIGNDKTVRQLEQTTGESGLVLERHRWRVGTTTRGKLSRWAGETDTILLGRSIALGLGSATGESRIVLNGTDSENGRRRERSDHTARESKRETSLLRDSTRARFGNKGQRR